MKTQPEGRPELASAEAYWKSPGRLGLAAVGMLFVLVTVALRWDARTGFTSLLSFGGPQWEQRLPVLRTLPLARDPGTGYDGQFGAQLAIEPDLRTPGIQNALDNPVYRARRIMLPWLAHVIGGSNPWTVLLVFALQNVAFWIGLAWLVLWEIRPVSDARAVAIWTGCMLTVGTLDSIRYSLNDLFSVLLLALAVAALTKGRPWLSTAAFALAGLTRETALLGGAALWPVEARGRRAWLAAAARCACASLPLIAWVGWLAWMFPKGNVLGRNNFDWPGFALARHCALSLTHLAHGDFDSRFSFGLIGAVGLGAQSLYLLFRPRFSEPWWRIGIGFALLFWILGDNVWAGYWAAARALLPMTFAFNLLAPDDRRFWLRVIVANAGLVLHGIWRMLP